MTPEELARWCLWIAHEKFRVLCLEQRFYPDFYLGKACKLYKLRAPPGIEMLLNNGAVKAAVFSLLRYMVHKRGYDAFIMATDTWLFEGNKRYFALSEVERHELIDRAFKRAVAEGYGKVHEAFTVTGQTPNFAHQVQMAYKDLEILSVESGAFSWGGGRMTMWGDWNEPGMREAYDDVTGSGQAEIALLSVGIDFDRGISLVEIPESQ